MTNADGLPGTPTPMDGKCGAFLAKRSREVGQNRYCGRVEGYGTDHLGIGQCKYHGGSTPNATKHAVRQQVSDKVKELRASLGDNAPPIGDVIDEINDQAARMKALLRLFEEMMHQLSTVVTYDQKGVESIRALISQVREERDRYTDLLKFMEKQNLRNRAFQLEADKARLLASVFLTVIHSESLQLSDVQVELATSLLRENMAPVITRMFSSEQPALDVVDAEIVD